MQCSTCGKERCKNTTCGLLMSRGKEPLSGHDFCHGHPTEERGWEKEFRNKFPVLQDLFLNRLRPQVEAFIRTIEDQSFLRGLEAGREQGIRQVGKWYKIPAEIEGDNCPVCGGHAVTIRGRFTFQPKRKICPTCAREQLEEIYSQCNNRDACTASTRAEQEGKG